MKTNFLTLHLKHNFNLDSFSSILLDYLKVNTRYRLDIYFIYYEPALYGEFLDKPIIIRISEINYNKPIKILYCLLLDKINLYNKHRLMVFKDRNLSKLQEKEFKADVIKIYYTVLEPDK